VNVTGNAVRHAVDGPWLGETETLGACPVCATRERTLEFEDLRDIVFRVAPGAWRLHRCHGCDCLYIDPRPTPASIGVAYAEYFTHEQAPDASLLAPRTLPRRLRNDYLAARFGYELPDREPFGRLIVGLLPARRRRYERLVRGFAKPGKASRLLDVGSGNGEFLLRMRELGWQVTGQDVDPKAAAVVRSAGIDCVEGPVESALFDGSFDVITLHHVVEHLHDPVRTLAACRALLAPGGRLWLATPHAASLGFRRFGRHWLGLDPPRHLILFSRKALAAALERAGFSHWEVELEIGKYGTNAAAADLRRRDTKGERISRFTGRAENLFGDAVELLLPRLRDELVAVARA